MLYQKRKKKVISPNFNLPHSMTNLSNKRIWYSTRHTLEFSKRIIHIEIKIKTQKILNGEEASLPR